MKYSKIFTASVSAALLLLAGCRNADTDIGNAASSAFESATGTSEVVITTLTPPLAGPNDIFTTTGREPAVTTRTDKTTATSTPETTAAGSKTTNGTSRSPAVTTPAATTQTTKQAATNAPATSAPNTTAPANPAAAPAATTKATTKPSTQAPTTQAAAATTPATTKPPATTATTPGAGANLPTGFLEDQEAQVAKMINELRKSVGAGDLTYDAGLCLAARIRSEEMCRNNYLAHSRPNGDPWSTVLAEAGVTGLTAMGENIAMMEGSGDHSSRVTAGAWYEMWKNSSGHYKNMISANYTKVGLGIYLVNENGKYKAYATTVFGK